MTHESNSDCKFRYVNSDCPLVKLEFGKDCRGDIILADEICPDTMRLWNDQNKSFDKDLFRNDSGDLLAGYRKVEELLINTL